jgi:UDP:flavonoid glycosyltransferase YjiC (YdhE family)
MRIFILVLGTRGDFEPFWHLAHALRRRGHQVTIGTSGFHLQTDPFVDWVRIGNGSREELTALLASMAGVDGVPRGARAALVRERWITPQLASGVDAIVANAAAHDYCITNLHLPMQRDGKVYPATQVLYDPPEDDSAFALAARHADEPRILKLVVLNQALVDPDRSWDARYRFTGFWQPAARTAPPPPALTAFLDAGSAPAVLTMGSMATFDAARLAAQFRAALAAAGMRGVLVAGWSGLAGDGDDHADGAALLTLAEADYGTLFARAACVIHHGGSGTVAAVMRAGVPSILLPQLGTQAQWGAILGRAGVCAAVLDSDTLETGRLADAMRRARDDGDLRRRCRDWAGTLGADNGAELAARTIESHWRTL